MVNISIVVGRVAGVVATDRSEYLIVEDNSNPQYPGKIACEFYGPDNRAKLNGVGQGELVRVTGSSRSREYNGKWFTSFSAFTVTRLPETRADRLTVTPANPDTLPF